MTICRSQRSFLLLGFVASGLGCATEPAPAVAGAPAAIEEAGATVQLHLDSASRDAAEVLIGYYRRPDQVGPRAVELLLDLSGSLEYVDGAVLDAARAADKQLVVQPRDGGLRVILYSTTTLERLDSGWLTVLRFRRSGGAEASITLTNTGDTFAPAEANRGFVPPEPLMIEGVSG